MVARSSAEAEYRAIALGVSELLWTRSLLVELSFTPTSHMKLFCNNKAAISIAHDPVQHDRTKHIEIDWHFIKEKISSGLLCTSYVKTGDQLADVLTKGLSSRDFIPIISKLGMINIFAQT